MTPASEKDLGDALRIFDSLSYVRQQDIAAIPVLETRPNYVVYGPLALVPVAPDVVLLFVQAGQTLILSEAFRGRCRAGCRRRWAGRHARWCRRR